MNFLPFNATDSVAHDLRAASDENLSSQQEAIDKQCLYETLMIGIIEEKALMSQIAAKEQENDIVRQRI